MQCQGNKLKLSHILIYLSAVLEKWTPHSYRIIYVLNCIDSHFKNIREEHEEFKWLLLYELKLFCLCVVFYILKHVPFFALSPLHLKGLKIRLMLSIHGNWTLRTYSLKSTPTVHFVLSYFRGPVTLNTYCQHLGLRLSLSVSVTNVIQTTHLPYLRWTLKSNASHLLPHTLLKLFNFYTENRLKINLNETSSIVPRWS